MAVNNTVAGEAPFFGGMKHGPTYHACILGFSCQISDLSVNDEPADLSGAVLEFDIVREADAAAVADVDYLLAPDVVKAVNHTLTPYSICRRGRENSGGQGVEACLRRKKYYQHGEIVGGELRKVPALFGSGGGSVKLERDEARE